MNLNLPMLLQQRPYWYQAVHSFADNANVQTPGSTSIQVQASWFVCTRIFALVRRDTDGQMPGIDTITFAGDVGAWADAPLLVSIRESGTDRVLMSNAVDAMAFSIHRQHGLPVPLLLRPSTIVTVDMVLLRDTGGATGLDARIVLEGFHDYSIALNAG